MKPDFFRHELLQDLETTYPGKHPMLVFAGLWGHCDREGRFLWRPKHLKLDILPFIAFEMAETLTILEQAKMVARYSFEGVEYGWIPSFPDHQAIGGKEASSPTKYPEPPREVIEKYQAKTNLSPGSDGEASETAGREGKGREGNGELFGQFWTAYPKKVAKQDAARAFEKLKLVNGDFERVMKALDVAKQSKQWKRDNGQYIPHAATWLNGKRFDDEAVASPRQHGSPGDLVV